MVLDLCQTLCTAIVGYIGFALLLLMKVGMAIRVKEGDENNGRLGSPDTSVRLMVDIDDCSNLKEE
jgi:hypothetical protein